MTIQKYWTIFSGKCTLFCQLVLMVCQLVHFTLFTLRLSLVNKNSFNNQFLGFHFLLYEISESNMVYRNMLISLVLFNRFLRITMFSSIASVKIIINKYRLGPHKLNFLTQYNPWYESDNFYLFIIV